MEDNKNINNEETSKENIPETKTNENKFKKFDIHSLKNKFKFKSVFTRLLVTYLGILFLNFLLVAGCMSTVLESYFMKQRIEDMTYKGEKIARQFVSVFSLGALTYSQLKDYLQIVDEYTDFKTLLVNKDGSILMESKDNIYAMDLDSTINLIGKDKLEQLFSGENIVLKNKPNSLFSKSTLTVGCPVIVQNNVVKGVLINSPIPNIKQSTADVYAVILVIVILSSLIAFILIYFTSRRITKPLKDINDAAKVIASGDFNKRIDTDSEDEISQLAQSFNEMAEGLNRLEEYRSNFITNISHDLRSPVTSIQGFLNAILDGTIPTEKQEKYLRIALEETKRLTKLTNDILELTKFENQAIELHKENFDINEMIRNIVMTFETRVSEKRIKMKVIFIHESSWVYADAQKIERVVYNLLDNAIKFTQEDNSITVETSEKGNKIYINVSDSGIGMTDEQLKHVFERFYKADVSRGKDKKGTGLGLAIVKEIIKAHKESISVKSIVGLGTTFSFSLEKSKEME